MVLTAIKHAQVRTLRISKSLSSSAKSAAIKRTKSNRLNNAKVLENRSLIATRHALVKTNKTSRSSNLNASWKRTNNNLLLNVKLREKHQWIVTKNAQVRILRMLRLLVSNVHWWSKRDNRRRNKDKTMIKVDKTLLMYA